jgi:hypothetical protein
MGVPQFGVGTEWILKKCWIVADGGGRPRLEVAMGEQVKESFERIEPGSPRGERWGFTPNRFEGYLAIAAEDPRYVYISVIESLQPGQGHLSALFAAIQADGLGIKVPTPMKHMRAIIGRKGFRRTTEKSLVMGTVAVWVCDPPNAT